MSENKIEFSASTDPVFCINNIKYGGLVWGDRACFEYRGGRVQGVYRGVTPGRDGIKIDMNNGSATVFWKDLIRIVFEK